MPRSVTKRKFVADLRIQGPFFAKVVAIWEGIREHFRAQGVKMEFSLIEGPHRFGHVEIAWDDGRTQVEADHALAAGEVLIEFTGDQLVQDGFDLGNDFAAALAGCTTAGRLNLPERSTGNAALFGQFQAYDGHTGRPLGHLSRRALTGPDARR